MISIYTPNSTDERLRWYLDTNQLARERLCLALLAMDKRFSNVNPRQPRGGPDGGRDLEGIFQGKYTVFGAVGFVNSASDSYQNKKEIIKKFKNDFNSAIKANGELKAFIFFTNVNLTASEKANLIDMTMKKGLILCDIYDRERIRIVLDSPDGLSLRYQYLQIPLSDAEQASFFAKWGEGIQGLISRKFEDVDNKLRRIQFIQESNNPLRSIMFYIELDNQYSINDLPHFRALISIMSPSMHNPFKVINLASCNNANRENPKNTYTDSDGISGAFWEDDIAKLIHSSKWIRNKNFKYITAIGEYSQFDIKESVPCLKDLDKCWFVFFVNKSLAEKIKSITITANEYKIWFSPLENLSFDKPYKEVKTPWHFTDNELSDKWVRIMPSGGVGNFMFSDMTPVRFYDAKNLHE